MPFICTSPTSGNDLLTPVPGFNGHSSIRVHPTFFNCPRHASIAIIKGLLNLSFISDKTFSKFTAWTGFSSVP